MSTVMQECTCKSTFTQGMKGTVLVKINNLGTMTSVFWAMLPKIRKMSKFGAIYGSLNMI